MVNLEFGLPVHTHRQRRHRLSSQCNGDAIYKEAMRDRNVPLPRWEPAQRELSSRLSQTWPGPGRPAHPWARPLTRPASEPAGRSRAARCLPVRGRATEPVRSGEQRPRGQPGGRGRDPGPGRRGAVGVALPRGSAVHLSGGRRVPGSCPARGALPILQGSGHGRSTRVSGVMDSRARGEKETGGLEARCRRGNPSAALQVRWRRRSRSGPAARSLGRAA